MGGMKRRAMLKTLLAAGAGVAASGFRLPLVHAADYRGKLFVFVQADGGWDPTSFCDPKANSPRASPSSTTGPNATRCARPGAFRYAPFAQVTSAFFDEVPPPDAGHQRSGCADELPHRGHRAQLERSQLRRVSDDDRAACRTLRAGTACDRT